MKISKKEFLILQINDSLFPIGSYSHSYGLETYIQKGIVHDEKTAERYLRMKLRYSFMYTDLLAVKLSYEAATKGDIYKLEELEDIMEASRIPEEIRCASRKLGSRFVKTLFCMDPSWKHIVCRFARNIFVFQPKRHIILPCSRRNNLSCVTFRKILKIHIPKP